VRQPRRTDTIADGEATRLGPQRVDDAHDLMTWNDERAAREQIALCEMQISPTDAAGQNPQPKLPVTGNRNLPLDRHKRT
jgi:hypothetical protein